MLRARLTAAATITLALTFASSARADSPAHDMAGGGVVLGVDRLMPLLGYVATSWGSGSTKTKSNETTSGLFAGDPLAAEDNPYALPRLAVDIVPIAHLSIGGSFWYYTQLSSSISVPGQPTEEQPKSTVWGIAPRIGYMLPFAGVLVLWPRAGVEYVSIKDTTPASGSRARVDALSLDLEAMLVVTPWHHFGFEIGPVASIPLAGHGIPVPDAPSVDFSIFSFQVTGGLVGYF